MKQGGTVVIEIKNLLFQPLTLHLAGDGRGLHLNPREIRSISDDDLSPEIEAAAKRGLVSLSGGSAPPKTDLRSEKPLDEPLEQEAGGKPKPKRRKRR
jgi:hypothetical protein